MMGLRDQLLNVVVSFEKPEKEKQRKELIHQMSENRKKLKEKEDAFFIFPFGVSGSLRYSLIKSFIISFTSCSVFP